MNSILLTGQQQTALITTVIFGCVRLKTFHQKVEVIFWWVCGGGYQWGGSYDMDDDNIYLPLNILIFLFYCKIL